MYNIIYRSTNFLFGLILHVTRRIIKSLETVFFYDNLRLMSVRFIVRVDFLATMTLDKF